MSCKYVILLFNNFKYSLNVPETLILGFESELSKHIGFLPKVSSYGLLLSRFGVLNMLCVNIAKGKYFGHI